MNLRVGSLLVSTTSRRRATVTGLTITMVRLEFGPGRFQWRSRFEIERLYRVI